MAQDPRTFVDICNRIMVLIKDNVISDLSMCHNLLSWVVQCFHFFSLYNCSCGKSKKIIESQHFGAIGEGILKYMYFLFVCSNHIPAVIHDAIEFDENVTRISIIFDPRCCTASEEGLQVIIKATYLFFFLTY